MLDLEIYKRSGNVSQRLLATRSIDRIEERNAMEREVLANRRTYLYLLGRSNRRIFDRFEYPLRAADNFVGYSKAPTIAPE